VGNGWTCSFLRVRDKVNGPHAMPKNDCKPLAEVLWANASWESDWHFLGSPQAGG